MTHPLDGVNAKLTRVVASLERLHSDIRAFAALRPFTVRIEEHDRGDGQSEVHVIAVDRRILWDVNINLLAGEIVYQLRSALDHTIHQLVLADGHGEKLAGSRRHQFPIFETEVGYRTRAPAMIDGVSPSVGRLIKDAQPFASTLAASAHPLWILQDLSNTDKHRVIPVSVVALEELEGRDSADDVTYADWFTMTGFGKLSDAVLLGKFPKAAPFIPRWTPKTGH